MGGRGSGEMAAVPTHGSRSSYAGRWVAPVVWDSDLNPLAIVMALIGVAGLVRLAEKPRAIPDLKHWEFAIRVAAREVFNSPVVRRLD